MSKNFSNEILDYEKAKIEIKKEIKEKGLEKCVIERLLLIDLALIKINKKLDRIKKECGKNTCYIEKEEKKELEKFLTKNFGRANNRF